MRYALKIGDRVHPLPEGKSLVGRGENCQIVLDDPLVSRVHAAVFVEADGLRIEDLGSRNGVRVNGEPLTAPRALALGDVIRVGSVELTVEEPRNPSQVPRDRCADTLVASVPTQRLDVFGVFGTLAEKALALGRGDEAERILSKPLEAYLSDTRSARERPSAARSDVEGVADARELFHQAGREGSADPGQNHRGSSPPAGGDDNFRRAADYALRLASTTGKGRWLDYLFRLHAAHGRLMEAALVDELYEIVRKVQGASSADLGAYLDVLRTSEEHRGPRERFLIGRLEGILALLR